MHSTWPNGGEGWGWGSGKVKMRSVFTEEPNYPVCMQAQHLCHHWRLPTASLLSTINVTVMGWQWYGHLAREGKGMGEGGTISLLPCWSATEVFHDTNSMLRFHNYTEWWEHMFSMVLWLRCVTGDVEVTKSSPTSCEIRRRLTAISKVTPAYTMTR